MKSIWQGSLSFGLVSIPVRLYSAIKEHAIGFTMLCKTCHEPIVYERWCKHCNKQVAWADIVKGLKLADGSYFILTKEALAQLKPHTTDTIDIIEFVKADQIKPIYLEHHYYLAPAKEHEKAFYLLKSALEKSGTVAVGTFVMRDKQYVCAINSYDEILLLSTLNYAYEIRPVEGMQMRATPAATLSADELKLALQLVAQRTVKKFDLAQFKDTFAQHLLEAIKKSKRKKRGAKKKVEKPIARKKERSSLLAGLRASLIAPARSGQPVAHVRKAKKR